MNKLLFSLLAILMISTNGFGQIIESETDFHALLSEAESLETTDPRHAIELYYEASQMNHPEVAKAFLMKGKFFLSMGNHPAAVADFETAMNAGTLTLTSIDMEVIGDAYLMNGKAEEACTIWNQALEASNAESAATATIQQKVEANCQ